MVGSDNRPSKRHLVRVPLRHRLSPVSRAVSFETLRSFTFELCKSIDTPRSLAVWILLREKEYSQLVSLECNPLNYMNAQSFADDYVVSKMLSKYPDFSHEDLDPEKAAMEKFHEFERLCKDTNRRFRNLREDPSQWDPPMKGIFLEAKRKIARVLGDVDLNVIEQLAGWGPGATTSTSGNQTSAYIKFSSELDITENAFIIGRACVNSTSAWVRAQCGTIPFIDGPACIADRAFRVVRGNEVVLVPKNAKTHRVIAKEPTVNSYLQKGIGSYIRSRLRNVARIDLKDQSVNQRLAKEGSITGALCTIDLSGASDSISYELVQTLLPEKWFSLLRSVRSFQGRLPDGSWIPYHKFSSMGNAYTFELESLIFWALLSSVLELRGGEQTLNVYGDDLVVPVEHFESVCEVINFSGFRVNEQKSFSSGPFRESCGKDYFFGLDVRPFFIKKKLANVESLYQLANSVRRYAHSRNFNYGCDYRFRTAWTYLFERCPPDLRFRIPEGIGDGGFVSNWDEASPRRPKWGWSGWSVTAITRVSVKRDMQDPAAAFAATVSVMRSSSENWWDPRRSVSFTDKQLLDSGTPLLGFHNLRIVTTPVLARIHVFDWREFGPWE